MTERLDAAEPQSNNVSDQAARNTLSLNPLVGVRGKDLMDSAATVPGGALRQPELPAVDLAISRRSKPGCTPFTAMSGK